MEQVRDSKEDEAKLVYLVIQVIYGLAISSKCNEAALRLIRTFLKPYFRRENEHFLLLMLLKNFF